MAPLALRAEQTHSFLASEIERPTHQFSEGLTAVPAPLPTRPPTCLPLLATVAEDLVEHLGIQSALSAT